MSNEVQLSMRAFAKQINVSEGAVRRAIREGKLVDGYDPDSKKIDPVAATKNVWVKQQSAGKAKAGVSAAKVMEKLSSSKTTKDVKTEDTEPTDEGEEMDIHQVLTNIVITSNMPYDKAMRNREIIALAKDKLALQEKLEVLVPKEKVNRTLYAIGQDLKKHFMNLPQKVAREIMIADKEVHAINILTNALTEILDEFVAQKTKV